MQNKNKDKEKTKWGKFEHFDEKQCGWKQFSGTWVHDRLQTAKARAKAKAREQCMHKP